MNQLAEKVAPVMNDAELEALIESTTTAAKRRRSPPARRQTCSSSGNSPARSRRPRRRAGGDQKDLPQESAPARRRRARSRHPGRPPARRLLRRHRLHQGSARRRSARWQPARAHAHHLHHRPAHRRLHGIKWRRRGDQWNPRSEDRSVDTGGNLESRRSPAPSGRDSLKRNRLLTTSVPSHHEPLTTFSVWCLVFRPFVFSPRRSPHCAAAHRAAPGGHWRTPSSESRTVLPRNRTRRED